MAIGHARQKGTLVYIYGLDGRQITSISAPGRWPDDGLKGFTRNAIHIRKGNLIYAYDEYGRRQGQPVTVKQGNVENINTAKQYALKTTEKFWKASGDIPEVMSA